MQNLKVQGTSSNKNSSEAKTLAGFVLSAKMVIASTRLNIDLQKMC
jgi:hypothetical protein